MNHEKIVFKQCSASFHNYKPNTQFPLRLLYTTKIIQIHTVCKMYDGCIVRCTHSIQIQDSKKKSFFK